MLTHHPSLASIFVGTPEHFGFAGAAAWFDEPWTTGIFKRPVEGPVHVTVSGLAGDGQADLVNHGGPDKAICVYSADHYAEWRRTLGLEDFVFGAFGENFTVAGLTEHDVCIGNLWAVGDALVQVSQPRQPCWKLARKWRLKDLSSQVVENGHTGWYFRVAREGDVARGAALALRERPHGTWTVAAANDVMHRDVGNVRELAALEPLSESWKRRLGTPRG